MLCPHGQTMTSSNNSERLLWLQRASAIESKGRAGAGESSSAVACLIELETQGIGARLTIRQAAH